MNWLILDKRFWFKLITLTGLAAFEIFNFATNQSAMELIFGDTQFVMIYIYNLVAIAFSAIDLGGLSSTFTEEKWPNEPWWVYVSTIAWFLASIVSGLLTYMSVAVAMTVAPVSQLAAVMPNLAAIYDFIPVAIAAVIWLIRVMLIGSAVAGSGHVSAPRPKPSTRPVHIGTQPTASQPKPAPAPAPKAPAAAQPGNESAPMQSIKMGPSLTKQDEDDLMEMMGLK